MKTNYKPLIAGLLAMAIGIWHVANAVMSLAQYYGW